MEKWGVAQKFEFFRFFIENSNFLGLTVEVKYRSKPIRFRISGVSTETAESKTFPASNGRTMNIAAYYREIYGIDLV